MTTILLLAPLAWLPLDLVAALMIAISTACLVYGAFRTGEPWRLWVLASWPFWYNVIYAQWGILLLAILFLPQLAWLTPVKPHLGISVFIRHARWQQVVYVLIFLAVTWIACPGWPSAWLAQTGGYDGFVPAFYLPVTILVILSLWRNGLTPRALWFTVFCLTPQRLWHDQILLWYAPSHAWIVALMAGMSWISPVLMHQVTADIWIWLLIGVSFVPAGVSMLCSQRLARP